MELQSTDFWMKKMDSVFLSTVLFQFQTKESSQHPFYNLEDIPPGDPNRAAIVRWMHDIYTKVFQIIETFVLHNKEEEIHLCVRNVSHPEALLLVAAHFFDHVVVYVDVHIHSLMVEMMLPCLLRYSIHGQPGRVDHEYQRSKYCDVVTA